MPAHPGLDPFPQHRLVALTNFIDILIPLIVLISVLAGRLENYRTSRFLAPTFDFLLGHGLLAAKLPVDNPHAPYCLMPKAVPSRAIVAALVVVREASPL